MCYDKNSSSWVATALSVVVAIGLGLVIHIPVAQAKATDETVCTKL